MSDRPKVPAAILEAVKDIEPVGEFGSKAWCAACAAGGVKLLKEANLPEDMEWAFSEVYTHAPERFHADGREIVGYYMLVKNGEVTGGDGAPEEVRNTVGFNITARWAAICSPSRVLYDGVGSKQRMEESEVMFAAIEEYVGRSNPLGRGIGPERVWFPEISTALGKNGGLHNIAAKLQAPSPEFADLPMTAMDVPHFAAMTDGQKQYFLELCGVDI
ncbi:MAG: hypothetical protein CMQ33_10010 [Gammaproteobacteria bacterium]|jgi:hypothetical protein|nr:hypothetical protein [Gammaproteobacteria bacterium]